MDKRYIAALEIGSSKIKGVVASVAPDGEATVLAAEEMPLTGAVRYGRVQNVQEVSSHASHIIRKLENHPAVAPRKVSTLVTALGGRSLGTCHGDATISFPGEIEVTAQTVARLKRDAEFNNVSDKSIYHIEPRKFFLDNIEVAKAIGSFGSKLKGEFTIVVCSPENQRNLDRIKIDGDDTISHIYVPRPVAMADMVLTASDKQLGVALIDFGAETTTISIYRSGALQNITTLPIGSRNITRDLQNGLSLTEDEAEHCKCTSASAAPIAATDNDNRHNDINNYTRARAGEIIANALAQITHAGFKLTDLPAGIIITGRGAKLQGFVEQLESQAKVKVRTASANALVNVPDSRMSEADNIDILSLVHWAAANVADDCLCMPATVDHDHDNPYGHNTTYRTPSEDDLLKDDEDDNDYNDNRAASRKDKRDGKTTRTATVNHTNDNGDDDFTIDRPIDEVKPSKIRELIARLSNAFFESPDDDADTKLDK